MNNIHNKVQKKNGELMMHKDNNSNILIKQEPLGNVIIRLLHNPDLWKNLFFSNIFQILPIWVMLLIQLVSAYNFIHKEYISNLLVFVIIASATNLSNLFSEDNFKLNIITTLFAIFISIFIICFASIMYCLILLNNKMMLELKIDILMGFSILFTLIVVYISIWLVVRKGK